MPELPDLTSPAWFLLAVLAFFAVVIGRYLLIAGVFFFYFYKWRPAYWRHRKLSGKQVGQKQFKREVTYSCITALIFAIVSAITLVLFQKGYTAIYLDVTAFGYPYFFLSFFIYILLHETYYYWLHRWMHRPAVFRFVHKVHHQSTTTSPWTAFSFHPMEGLLQAIFLPLLLILIPVHPYVLLAQLTLMSLSSVINHLDIEIYPRRFNRHILGKWMIGATHHSLHHKQFRYNYGLYFTFWDKWEKTESPNYDSLFEEKTSTDEDREHTTAILPANAVDKRS